MNLTANVPESMTLDVEKTIEIAAPIASACGANSGFPLSALSRFVGSFAFK